MVNPSIIPFNLHEMHLERLSKKVKFALIDRRNATREQVPIGHFTMFKSLINGLMHTSYIYRVHSGIQVHCQYFEELPKSQVAILGVMSYNVTKLTTQSSLSLGPGICENCFSRSLKKKL